MPRFARRNRALAFYALRYAGGIPTLATVAKQPVGFRVSVSDRNIVVEMTGSLGADKQSTTVRIARGGSLDLLDERLATLRSTLVVWWGSVGDALWAGGEPGEPGQAGGGPERPHLHPEDPRK